MNLGTLRVQEGIQVEVSRRHFPKWRPRRGIRSGERELGSIRCHKTGSLWAKLSQQVSFGLSDHRS